MIKISVDDFSRTSEEYLRKNMLSLNASSYCIFDWENRKQALLIEPTPPRSAVESSNTEQHLARYEIFYSNFYFWKMRLTKL